MSHTRDWDSGVPIDHTKFKAIPGAIAALALDIEERLQAFFYGFTSGETSDGIKYLPFWVQTTGPTGAANKVCLYSEDSNSKAALKLKTEDNAEIQLSERDWGLLDDFALGNNTPLRARNAADNGFVNILKINSTNQINFPAQILLDDGFDCNKKQAVNMVIENRTNDTGMTTTGMIWFRTDV
jgi:hypothetical protein